MQKVIFIAIIASIPVLLAIYGIYYFGPYQHQRDISLVMDGLNESYYKGVASECYKKDISQHACCLSSVKEMSRIKARLVNDPICVNLFKDSIKCEGSYEWCVPTRSTKKDTEERIVTNECFRNDDCVPATCCHPTDVVNTSFAPDCADTMCTMSCETILDCGRAIPVCDNGKCVIQSKEGNL